MEGTPPEFREVAADLCELIVNVGLMDSVIRHYPPHVRKNWAAKLEGYREFANQQIIEIQMFGEAFDEEETEE